MEIKLSFIIARMLYFFVPLFNDKMGTDDSGKRNSLVFLFLHAEKRLFNVCQVGKFFLLFVMLCLCTYFIRN